MPTTPWRSKNIPVAFYYGDYIGQQYTDVPAAAMWSMMALHRRHLHRGVHRRRLHQHGGAPAG